MTDRPPHSDQGGRRSLIGHLWRAWITGPTLRVHQTAEGRAEPLTRTEAAAVERTLTAAIDVLERRA